MEDLVEENAEEESFDGEATGTATAKTTFDDPSQHPDAADTGEVSAEVPFNSGGDLDSAVDKYGADLVYNYFQTLFKRKLQNKIRRALKDGVRVETVEDRFSIENYDPTASSRGRSSEDPLVEAQKSINQLSDEEKAQLRDQLDL